jgi:hypothetical protein
MSLPNILYFRNGVYLFDKYFSTIMKVIALNFIGAYKDDLDTNSDLKEILGKQSRLDTYIRNSHTSRKMIQKKTPMDNLGSCYVGGRGGEAKQKSTSVPIRSSSLGSTV